MKRLLVFGFGPFGTVRHNPTSDIVLKILPRVVPDATGVLLRTSYREVDDRVPQAIDEHKPDVVIIFGLATRSSRVRVEQVAHNEDSLKAKDHDGCQGVAPIVPTQRQTLRSSLPVTHIEHELGACGIAFVRSTDAGRYVCNHALFRALDHVDGGPPVSVGLIHIPTSDHYETYTGRALDVEELVRVVTRAALYGGQR